MYILTKYQVMVVFLIQIYIVIFPQRHRLFIVENLFLIKPLPTEHKE